MFLEFPEGATPLHDESDLRGASCGALPIIQKRNFFGRSRAIFKAVVAPWAAEAAASRLSFKLACPLY